MTHITVLLHEAIDALNLQPDGRYLDATFGRGGHSRLILERLGDKGQLYALDRDPQAAEVAWQWVEQEPRFHFAPVPFSRMQSAFSDVGAESLDGILFDFGVSSPQLDQAERGFSFHKAAPLDMRMDTRTGMTAYQWLQEIEESALVKAIVQLGGEPYSVALRIGNAIIKHREKIVSTIDLANVVAQAVPKKFHRVGYHPATQTFQAIRMMVNDEVGEIEQGLQSALTLLKKGGIMVAIGFHDVEDKLVKHFARAKEGRDLPAEIPVAYGRMYQELHLQKSVIKPSQEEILNNPRSRSAKMRVMVKV
ncbi:MAG: 16S rRNA (cytosine(1402)-N(4))-methyltransferase RsmH [Cardiobacteriaceae bacterium]|nr:16S rRNA (cytosine(1402)-N(4))-methyltransferase RsmH [Cardiobacteriaceae bacterium]